MASSIVIKSSATASTPPPVPYPFNRRLHCRSSPHLFELAINCSAAAGPSIFRRRMQAALVQYGVPTSINPYPDRQRHRGPKNIAGSSSYRVRITEQSSSSFVASHNVVAVAWICLFNASAAASLEPICRTSTTSQPHFIDGSLWHGLASQHRIRPFTNHSGMILVDARACTCP